MKGLWRAEFASYIDSDDGGWVTSALEVPSLIRVEDVEFYDLIGGGSTLYLKAFHVDGVPPRAWYIYASVITTMAREISHITVSDVVDWRGGSVAIQAGMMASSEWDAARKAYAMSTIGPIRSFMDRDPIERLGGM